MICRKSTSKEHRLFVIQRDECVKNTSYELVQYNVWIREIRKNLPEKYKSFVWT